MHIITNSTLNVVIMNYSTISKIIIPTAGLE